MESKKRRTWIVPSPVPPLPPSSAMVRSVTMEEIKRFWRRKRMEEEDHLLAAQKAAARIKARALTEEDYRRFEESLCDDDRDGGKVICAAAVGDSNKERVGIKDSYFS